MAEIFWPFVRIGYPPNVANFDPVAEIVPRPPSAVATRHAAIASGGSECLAGAQEKTIEEECRDLCGCENDSSEYPKARLSDPPGRVRSGRMARDGERRHFLVPPACLAALCD